MLLLLLLSGIRVLLSMDFLLKVTDIPEQQAFPDRRESCYIHEPI